LGSCEQRDDHHSKRKCKAGLLRSSLFHNQLPAIKNQLMALKNQFMALNNQLMALRQQESTRQESKRASNGT
jgi:hypothetical protein